MLEEPVHLSFLNENAFLEPHLVAQLLKTTLTEDVKGEERANLLTEIKCFEFFLQTGELRPMFESVLTDGSKHCYPDIMKFTEEEVKYIQTRLNDQLHPFPKARYSHILWLIKKHNQFGVIAIESYKELTSLYFQKASEGLSLYHEFCHALECYHSISVALKYQKDDCRDEVLVRLKNRNLPLTWRDNIINIVLSSPFFKKVNLKGLTNLMLTFIDESSEFDYFNIESLLKSCISLSQKEGVSSSEIYNRLGENELRLADKREDDKSGMILISCYRNAAYYFKMAGNEEMNLKASALYTKQKGNLKLGLFQYELPTEQVQILNDEQNAIVGKWLNTVDGSPFWHLVFSKGLLMEEATLNQEARDNMKNSFMYFASMQVYDLNNNAKTLDEDDKLAHQKFQNYIFHLQLSTISIIEKFLYKGIKTGKFDRHSIIAFFNQTWLAKGIEEYTSDEQSKTFAWIELLGPGLYEIVSQLEIQILDNKFTPNFLLGIDSITIKIEGIIRDLARLSGISVTKIKEDEAVEMNIDDLLRDEKIGNLFKSYDLLFFKYLLTRQGWNYRNNVAHAFYRPSDYQRTKAILLLLAVFRLCKYDIISGK